VAGFCLHGSELYGSIVDEKFFTETVGLWAAQIVCVPGVWTAAAGILSKDVLFVVLGKWKDIFKIAEKAFK